LFRSIVTAPVDAEVVTGGSGGDGWERQRFGKPMAGAKRRRASGVGGRD